jgi:hypothetical protein
MGSNSEDYIFYSCLLGLLIKWLDDATCPYRPHKIEKKRSTIVDHSDTVPQLSNIVAIDLIEISVPAEDG